MLFVALLLAGCRSSDPGGSAGGSSRDRDPLVVGPGKIPKQNLPIPGRDTGTAGAKSDPLLGSPTGRSGSRIGYADDPNRRKQGPYVPNQGGTPAALAARPADDGEGLRMDVVPAGGSEPAARGSVPAGDDVFAELAGYGVRRADVVSRREGGRVEVIVRVPGRSGAPARGYFGEGATEAAALRQVLDHLRVDGR